MELRPNLSQKLTQQQVMTPQLQHAIKLLQMNRLEIIDQINQEFQENPTLEEVPGSAMEASGEAERILAEQSTDVRTQTEEQGSGTKDGEVDWSQYLERSAGDPARSTGSAGMDELPPIETNLTAGSSLEEHLEWQLQMQFCTDAERQAASVIIRSLDDRGWLSAPLEEICAEHGLDLEDAESALLIVQGLDPLGCGTRNLEDCLLVQVKTLYPEDPNFPRIIQEHLGDLERRNYQGIAKALGIDKVDVEEYHKMIRMLEPWPARNYSSGETQYISPDVYVYKIGDEWQIVQNEDGMPKLKISGYYQKVLQGKDSTREERDYIKERLNSATFLLDSIYRRQNTINKVVRAILARQQGFFEHGADHLRPMVLRDVADEVGAHESTVSRVTAGKYLQCPQGIFELKYFFNNGVNAVNGEQVAAEAVKLRIKKLIQSENHAKPYSDEDIVKMLKKENIDIARRTVAKYREAMGIFPASRRKGG